MFSPKLPKFHISFICKLCYHICMITFLCSFNSSPPGSHPLPKIANSASSCCSHFGATSYQSFAPGGLGSIPCCIMCIFFKFLIIFLQKSLIFLQKSSNFFAKTIKLSYKNRQNFPIQLVEFSSRNRQVFLKKSSNFPAKIFWPSCINR